MSTMGVVVQEMIDARAAGVIFTADPVTGNPFHMIITGNYGLGEVRTIFHFTKNITLNI